MVVGLCRWGVRVPCFTHLVTVNVWWFVTVPATHTPASTAQLLPSAPAPGQVDVVRPAMPLLALALTVILCAVPVAQVGALKGQNRAAGITASAG